MFFGRKREVVAGRVPPNQRVTTGWPVLHTGGIPAYTKDLSNWDLRIYGQVEEEMYLSFEELLNLPQYIAGNDIHCVTGWSKLDNEWKGIQTLQIAKLAGVKPEAQFVILHAEEGWSTNLPLADFLRDTSLLAHSHNGDWLTPEHGYPLRAVIPHLYFWKSAKWVRAIEFTVQNKPGFWERNGYHMYGRPWKEERFSWD
ncbi:sulfite oxidase-like oxidoreductase [Pseudalkalibacillus caeni]|uniref:Sulfite oxidase-like oxidoreductase n=1 Tax=Exobacillus caeni TaxID=2574798 RepID=A0A5R9F5Q1_9BACL|nr:sulfite oxidase-like oxidoreductase [Pseudalkalibacillus caeni]TLS38867.1 sulfite oxidase-like oxidoreductase [Pseudalkalibacillus caeni]